jgi:hypothetical protein
VLRRRATVRVFTLLLAGACHHAAQQPQSAPPPAWLSPPSEAGIVCEPGPPRAGTSSARTDTIARRFTIGVERSAFHALVNGTFDADGTPSSFNLVTEMIGAEGVSRVQMVGGFPRGMPPFGQLSMIGPAQSTVGVRDATADEINAARVFLAQLWRRGCGNAYGD